MQIKCLDISKVHVEPFADVKTLVLRGCDLEINSESQECIVIFGASGCGKTTLLEILTLGQPVTTGSVEVNGKSVEKFNRKDRIGFFRRIGYLKQNISDNLFPTLKVTDNLLLPLKNQPITHKEKLNRIKRLLDDFDLEQRKHFITNQLSGGELQRLGLAIAISTKPEILFLDEPFSDQDFIRVKQITTSLKNLQEEYGMAIIIASHNPYISKLATKTLHLDRGQIKEVYSSSEINTDKEENIVVREGNKLYLPINSFHKNVNLLRLKISNDIQISEYNGPSEVSKDVICYYNPKGVISVPCRLANLLIYDKYELQIKNDPRILILNGMDR